MFSKTANNSGSMPFSEEDVRRVLSSAEGRQLLAHLRQSSGSDLNRAIEAVRMGDLAGAGEILAPMLRDPDAAKLLQSLGHG